VSRDTDISFSFLRQHYLHQVLGYHLSKSPKRKAPLCWGQIYFILYISRLL